MASKDTSAFILSKATGAMIGAAYGDALGWPNERIPNSKISQSNLKPSPNLIRWLRPSGDRFHPYDEWIEAGEYSDDTQLILCLSRSLYKGRNWWNHFTRVELPLWSLYDRGGGGATKRAVKSWLGGLAPWDSSKKPKDIKLYFDAGGNGVAMRTLPHILRISNGEFSEVADQILLDGISTHGHPRALLGALCYGFALWTAYRHNSNLNFGELAKELGKNKEIWCELRINGKILTDWKTQALRNNPKYLEQWESTKREVLDLLSICTDAISEGATSVDREVLDKLQCFDRKIGSSGIKSAIAAVYLASKHAASPMHGVVYAAFATGSDTDTIASMTGGLLGSIHGTNWLSPVSRDIQDVAYIQKTASGLIKGQIDDSPAIKVVKASSLEKLRKGAQDITQHSEINLPSLQLSKVEDTKKYTTNNQKFIIEISRLKTNVGQSIYLRSKFTKIEKESPDIESSQSEFAFSKEGPIARRCSPKIQVSSFSKSIHFYSKCLGLKVKREKSDFVVFEQGLILIRPDYEHNLIKGAQYKSMVSIQVSKIDECYSRVQQKGFGIISQPKEWNNTKTLFFRCFDPDGHFIEVFAFDNE